MQRGWALALARLCPALGLRLLVPNTSSQFRFGLGSPGLPVVGARGVFVLENCEFTFKRWKQSWEAGLRT